MAVATSSPSTPSMPPPPPPAPVPSSTVPPSKESGGLGDLAAMLGQAKLAETEGINDSSAPDVDRVWARRVAAGGGTARVIQPDLRATLPCVSPVDFSVQDLYNAIVDTGLVSYIADTRGAGTYAASHVRLAKSLEPGAVEELVAMAGVTYQRLIVIGEGDTADALVAGCTADAVSRKLKVLARVSSAEYQHFAQRFLSLTRGTAAPPVPVQRGGVVQRSYPSLVEDPWLYLGGAQHARDAGVLQELGVTHILNMADELDNNYDSSEYVYLGVGCDDTVAQKLLDKVDVIYDFLTSAQAANGKVLCHCAMGISRSCAAVLIYAMKAKGEPLDEALARVRQARSIVNPNEGFIKQLRQLEAELGIK